MSGEEFKHDPKAKEWVDPYPKKRNKSWIWGIVLILALYFLGAGPVTRLAKNKTISWTTASRIYWPLNTLAHNFQPFETFLDWYIDLWVPKGKG